jgi:cytoskeletal protein CcmA (bactofilin family)
MAVKSEQEITQIGSTVLIKGDISGKSDVRVAGKINGSINIDGELIIEKAGYVEGEIKSVTSVIAGSVKGNIDTDKLILESNSQFVGNIKTKQLIIQEGAIFQGNCQMGTHAAAPAQQAPAAPKEPIKL